MYLRSVSFVVVMTNEILSLTGVWPKRDVKFVDIIRMMCTCEVLMLEPTQSIHNMICKTLDFNPKKYLK